MRLDAITQPLPDGTLLDWRAHAPTRDFFDRAQATLAHIDVLVHGANRHTRRDQGLAVRGLLHQLPTRLQHRPGGEFGCQCQTSIHLQLQQHGAFRHLITRRKTQFGDHPWVGSRHRVFHFHRLQDGQSLTRCH